MLEELIHTPVIGVIPYMDLDLDEEDSLSSKLSHTSHTPSLLDLAVIRLPRISPILPISLLWSGWMEYLSPLCILRQSARQPRPDFPAWHKKYHGRFDLASGVRAGNRHKKTCLRWEPRFLASAADIK